MDRKSALSMAFAIASILFLSACTKSETGNGGNNEFHHITLNAGSVSDKDESAESTVSKSSNDSVDDEIATKSIFIDNSSTADFYWQKKDQIGVLASGSESLYPLTLESRSDDLKTATFGGDIKGTLGGYAVYPYNENHKISGNTLTYHLPSEYDFTDLAGEYLSTASSSDLDSYVGNATPALFAKISTDGTTAEFKHLGGVLCIRVEGSEVNYAELTITADRQISGDFSVDLSSDSPQIETSSAATADPEVESENNTVKIKGGIKNQTKKTGIFYIPMPVGEYKLRIKFGYPNGTVSYSNVFRVTAEKKLSISRTNIKRASFSVSSMHKNGGYMLVEGIKYIDLGLPSGTLWATKDYNATLPADYGTFYTWDEANSAISEKKKYHIPTQTECEELINNSYTERSVITQTNSAGETKKGMLFTSKNNGYSIFLPFTGYYNASNTYRHENINGTFWTSSTSSTNTNCMAVLGMSYDTGYTSPHAAIGGLEKVTARACLRTVVTP